MGPGLCWSGAWAGAHSSPSAQEPQCSPGPAAIQEQHGRHQAMSTPSPNSAPRQVGGGAWPQESLLAQSCNPGSQSLPTPALGLALHKYPINPGRMGRESNAQPQLLYTLTLGESLLFQATERERERCRQKWADVLAPTIPAL